ncbi:hypothetical protein KXJ72_18170 (plasmid) [Comamonas aquatica]|nr:hypothetical protein KXJ72_18170 [Comamonas aquatica]
MTAIYPLPDGLEASEEQMTDWQGGDLKPEVEGPYLRDLEDGEAVSFYSGGKWRRDCFFSSDIQNAPWRGMREKEATHE